MEIVRTEGCVVYGTTIDGKSIEDYSKEDLKNIFLNIFNNHDFSKEEYADILTELLEISGSYNYCYTCEECGDAVVDYKLNI